MPLLFKYEQVAGTHVQRPLSERGFLRAMPRVKLSSLPVAIKEPLLVCPHFQRTRQ